MMNRLSGKASKARALFASAVFVLFAAGCDTRDDRSGCLSQQTLRFEYTHNKDRADLFSATAECLDLFIYDADGAFVRTVRASRAAGTLAGDNSVSLTLPHGEYTVVAWANLHNGDYGYICNKNINEHRVSLTAPGGEAPALPSNLMHGKVRIVSANRNDGAETIVPMIKDTNDVTVILRVTDSSGPVTEQDFTVSATGSNGTYKSDNSKAECPLVTYTACCTAPDASTFRADFRTLRLLTGDDTMLHIEWPGNHAAAAIHIPLVAEILKNPDYATDDDLDRYDHYTLVYEIDRDNDGSWSGSLIEVNGWTLIEGGGWF